MLLDMASASMALVVLLIAWFMPLVLFLFTARMRGSEKFSWALVISALTWPGYALFLFLSKAGSRHS